MRQARTLRTLLTAGALLAAAANTALAVDSKDNAALAYWRVFSLVTPDRAQAISSFDRGAIGEAGFAIDDGVVLETILDDSVIGRLVSAASRPDCDFSIEYDRGIEALLPHLGPMRTGAIMLVLRARHDLDRGEVAHATDAIEAALRSSQHLVDDDILISSLVSVSILASTQPVIEYAVEAGLLDAGQRQELRAALDRYGDEDPFGILSSVRREKRMIASWAAEHLSGPRAAETLAAMTGDEEDKATKRLLAGDLRGQIALYELFMDKAIEALAARDARALGELRDAVRAGGFGDLTLVITPSLHRVLQNMTRADEMLNSLRATLAR